MAFMIYEHQDGQLFNLNETFHLAGHQLLYKSWVKLGKPINKGWRVSADDLIRLHTEDEESYETRRLLIDFDPTSRSRIGFIELLDVYLFTCQDDVTGAVGWSPMMLRLQDIFYDEWSWPQKSLTPEKKVEVIRKLEVPTERKESVEFLYLTHKSER